MNTGLLIGAVVLSGLFLVLLIFSFAYSYYLRKRVRGEGPVDLTNENGEIDPIKQIKHLKKSTQEFGIKYDELKFGKLLGKGSQGEVFKATWRGLPVAVKKVDTRKVPPEIIEEFCQEAQIMRRLRHPTLTLFMGVSLEHPHLCILTELVSRGSLFDIIHDEHAALTWNKCLGIAVDVARGMTYLHAHSPPILHRDLKSLNILVDENWRGKVADFGMTRFQEDGTMTQCGSPLWMAPEMIRNDPYDEKSDVYSFAICLWEMYTRKIPYRDLGLNPSHLVVKVVKEHLRPPIPKQCPRAFKNLMEKCWAPLPEKRPTFPQILKIMEGFLQDPAILNHKPMSSRDSTIIVRPDRIDDHNDGILGLAHAIGGQIGHALGLQSTEKAWKIEPKEVTFYNESAATYQDLSAAGVIEAPATGPGRGVRQKSITVGSLPAADLAAVKAIRVAAGTEPAEENSDKSSKSKETNGKRLSRKSSNADPASPTPTDPIASPSSTKLADVTPAPLVLNTNIKSTKEAKVDETAGDPASSGGFSLAKQGAGILVGKFRSKIVAVKPCYLSRTHLTLSNEERVQQDLDGRIKETKLGILMKKVSQLRHPNITLFMGAYVDSIENLKVKLKESGGTMESESKDSKESTASPAASSSSSSSSTTVATLPAPPADCDFYLGLVQEFMPRGTLHDILCDSSLVVDWDTMIQLLIDAASGMAYLHGNHPHPVIHQDLNSHRLLIDKNWRVKVNEFGFVDLQAQLSGQALPPTIWSSPEYIKNPNLTNLSMASNVYSFGLIMWQALVRKPLYDNRPLTKDLIDRIVKQGDRPVLPSSLAMQKDFKNLIEKTWMADPHARPTFSFILEELNRLKKLGPPKIQLKLGVNAHKYRKAKTVFAYRSKDPVTILKDWGTNLGKKNCIIIFSGDDDVYLCDEDVFKSTYEKLESGAGSSDQRLGLDPINEEKDGKTATGLPKAPTLSPSDPMSENDHHEYRKTGTVLARCMEEAFSVKTDGGSEHGMAGDYLVQNEQGDQWSIEAKTFLELYERWD